MKFDGYLVTGKTFLVTDNNLAARQMMGLNLKRYGAKYNFAETAEQILKELQTVKYDVLLLDMELPEVDCYELVNTIRTKIGLSRDVLVIIGTSHRDFEPERYTEGSLNGYILKPFGAGEVLSLLQEKEDD